jgi:benzoyl-CoA reductase/2-hydroxyglutaryl-CoA dehydratase subunit BcrC/BadD/HgdB
MPGRSSRDASWRENRASHMSHILYSCPYIPAEWIAAHSLRPRRVLPRSVAGMLAGCCPYVTAFQQQAAQETQAAGIIVTTLCDQMRRTAELLARQTATPVFLFNLPATWHPAAVELYRAELARLGDFLVRVGGVAPTPETLTAVRRQLDRGYHRCRTLIGALPAQAYADMLADFFADPLAPPAVIIPRQQHGIPLALVGVPLLRDSFPLLARIESAGGRVVLQATESGELSLPAPWNELTADPVEELVHAYFGAIPHAFRRPNTQLYDWLAREFAARGVTGVIFLRYLWCDLWHAEVQRLREWTALPVLELDVSPESGALARMDTRIQSLLEMLA